MKFAIVGATGLVGNEILKVLEESKVLDFLKPDDIIPVASMRSIGKEISFKNSAVKIKGLTEAVAMKPEFAVFSAGSSVSMSWAHEFTEAGSIVIDNSSAWRKHKNIPLVVPEINIDTIKCDTKLIANPNCSTIQLVVVLGPLHKKYVIKRIVVSTYQSVTGTGAKAVAQLEAERKGLPVERVYPHPIDLNLIPHGGTFNSDGYTTEEVKLIDETRKILNSPDLRITSTVVRVPVLGGHSESVNIEFENEFDLNEVCSLLADSPGIVLQDRPEEYFYPMPAFAQGKDEVFVGRIRRDYSARNSLNMWIVADNLRKGAATNAIQIAEHMYSMSMHIPQ